MAQGAVIAHTWRRAGGRPLARTAKRSVHMVSWLLAASGLTQQMRTVCALPDCKQVAGEGVERSHRSAGRGKLHTTQLRAQRHND